MQVEQLIIDRIQRKQLKWHGTLLRMDGSRWPKKTHQGRQIYDRRTRRPQQPWKKEVTDFLRSINLEE